MDGRRLDFGCIVSEHENGSCLAMLCAPYDILDLGNGRWFLLTPTWGFDYSTRLRSSMASIRGAIRSPATAEPHAGTFLLKEITHISKQLERRQAPSQVNSVTCGFATVSSHPRWQWTQNTNRETHTTTKVRPNGHNLRANWAVIT